MSRRIAEGAAELLSAAASNDRYFWWCADHMHGPYSEAHRLADKVVGELRDEPEYLSTPISEFYAEAEARLRTGREP